jgi:hypothetical protein
LFGQCKIVYFREEENEDESDDDENDEIPRKKDSRPVGPLKPRMTGKNKRI